MLQAFLLFGAGVLAGIVNALAGGGSFIAYPALLLAGVPPVMANATNTFAALPGYASGAVGYWAHLKSERHRLPVYIAISIVGTYFGAELLLSISDDVFNLVLPWLMGLAVFLFAFGSRINAWIAQFGQGRRHMSLAGTVALLFLLFLVNVYGGFFNGGMGIILLAFLALAGLKDIHAMNGLKLALSAIVALVAVIKFASAGAIAWVEGGWVFAGTLVGGFVAARLAQRVPVKWVRVAIVIYGTVLTLIFFYFSYFQST